VNTILFIMNFAIGFLAVACLFLAQASKALRERIERLERHL
jgi:hypothetical protein